MPFLTKGPTVTCRILNGLEEFMATKGLDFAASAWAVGIDPAQADNPDGFIDFAAVLDLFETAAHASNDDAFGLHFAEFCPLCPIGLYHFVIFNAPTLREALETRARFSKLVVSGYSVGFEIDDGIGYYKWDGPDLMGPRTQFLDYAVTLLVERVRIILDEQSWVPLRVDFHHKQPRSWEEFSRGLGKYLRFEQAATCVLFDANSLARKLPAANTVLYRDLKAIAEGIAGAPTGAESLANKIRQHLIKSLAYEKSSEASIANELGVSVRTLQRELAGAGLTFTQLVDDTRMRAAHQMLVETNLLLTEVAFLLGFSELSAFSRASRNWFGEPASSLRKRAKMTGFGT